MRFSRLVLTLFSLLTVLALVLTGCSSAPSAQANGPSAENVGGGRAKPLS